MPSDHDIDLCRAAYKVARQNGAPPAGVTRLGADFFVVETKDGEVRETMSGLCCAWAMKFEITQKWLNKKAVS
jgi:hypothetical protein